jgi:protein-tyrosine phosphatase
LSYADLHCHWIAGIDDGCRTPEAGAELLKGLYSLGFSTVIATPHMRPGMFDNDKAALERAFARMQPTLAGEKGLPEVHLASEHWFDEVVFERLKSGAGLPYPALAATPARPRRGVLVELNPSMFPPQLGRSFTELRRKGLAVVLAHPERYQPVWDDDRCLDPLLDAGARLLLDICSIVGKYGRAPQKAAEKLLEDGAYEAACSDAHKPEDLTDVARAIERLAELVGEEERERLLGAGPRSILEGVS